MRRAYILLLACLVVFVPLMSVSAASDDVVTAQTTGPYAVSSGAVNVRGGPGTGFWIRGTLFLGEVVPILGISPDGAWWYIQTTFGEGWVAGVGVTAYNTGSVGVFDPGPIGTVTAGVLHVRFGAGEFSASLGQISMGQQVYVLARNADGSWLQIRWAYGTGWIASAYLSVTGLPAAVIDDGSGGMAQPSTAAVPLTSDTPYALVMATYLNIRTGPGINYAVLGTAYASETLPIVGRSADNSWYQVVSRSGTGWVSAAFVVTRNEFGGTPVTTGTVTAETAATGPIGIINTGALNIRSGPGIQYSSIGTLAGGTQTQIVGRTADWSWWLLDTPVGTGWANAIYIIVRGDTAGVPHVTPGTTAAASPGYPAATAPEAVVTGPMAFVATGALNIRSGPNSVFSSLGSVGAGTRMPIIGQSPDRGWWYVQSPYGNGFVSKLYVIAEGDTSGVPIVQ